MESNALTDWWSEAIIIISRNAEKNHKIKNLFKTKLLANSEQMVNFLKPNIEYPPKTKSNILFTGKY